MTDRYAVVGNPVAHSRSPAIHAAFARQTGEDILYSRLLAPLDNFARTVAGFFDAGGKGVNVTLPFKGEAARLATKLSERARRAEAANTLRFDVDGIYGDNTDGPGLVRDLTVNLGAALAGRRVLLIGAGGAASGVVGALLGTGVARLVIANRTRERAEALARRHGAPVAACGLEDLGGEPFDVLINATSAGLAGAALPLPAGAVAPGAFAYDMAYGPLAEPFLAAAGLAGAARLADGLGMLVEQAAESFLVWRGIRPDSAPVLAELRAAR
ncbi:MAG: shikimate dehydrogenase [Burkholderiales bacterium]|nr:shikimate dehydrogenase [Burkholderiales bacterium]